MTFRLARPRVIRSRALPAAVIAATFFAAAHYLVGFAADPPATTPKPAAAKATAPKSPISPQDSLKLFKLDDGLRIELAACEPQIVDPVTVRFDERGRMWVVEYRDYPNGPKEGEKPLSRIKVLDDSDGDGFYETAHTFADELSFCNGLQPWQGGVIATMAGRIAYLKDTDGDDKADVVETWYTGFAEENPQLRVNHPRFGLDNRIYVANGLRGGSAVDARNKDAKPVSLRGHDLKFDPRSGAYEAISGNGQFGLTFDDWGNRFLCSNRNPLYHVVFEDSFLARNPNYAVPAIVNDVAAAGETSKVFPIVEAWTTSILHAGQFTAACGIDIYRGHALPAEYYGNSFTCEPTGSLVHREIISPSGATFTGRLPYEGREFLASSDPWFRPVFCEGGPDGALYVCDMYRAVIEHPQFMPEELKNRPDLRAGEDRGRIYRIVGKDDLRRPLDDLSAASALSLTKLFQHPNAWQRETAQRLLIERQDRAGCQDALETIVTGGRTPQAKVHALWTLHGLKALTKPTLVVALRDVDPQVRRQAIILGESYFEEVELARHIIDAASQATGTLLFQAIASMPPIDKPERVTFLADAVTRNPTDVWLRRAVLANAGSRSAELLRELSLRTPPSEPAAFDAARDTIRELASLAALGPDHQTLRAIAADLRSPESGVRGQAYELPFLNGIAKSLKDKLSDVAGAQWVYTAMEIVKSPSGGSELRCDACDLLAYAPFTPASSTLLPLLRDDDAEVRSHAIAALAVHRDPQVGSLLLDAYATQAPLIRGQILDALLSRPERVKVLLDAMESGKFKARELDQARAARLLKSNDATLKARAEKLLASAMPADRTKALEDYRRVLTMASDPRRGKEVFKKNCAACHQVGDVGIAVGPSIADLRTKTPEQVLVDVIQPNKAIDNNFVSYTLVTTDGLQYVGILGAETPGSVTLKLPDGKTVSVLKKDIEEFTNNGISLMPEGVERQIPHQDMADVIAFVKNWRYLDGAVPGAPGAPAGGK